MSMEAENYELHAAIKRGDVEEVDRALRSGVSPNSEIYCAVRIDEIRSLLYFAAEVCLPLKRKIHSFLLLIYFL